MTRLLKFQTIYSPLIFIEILFFLCRRLCRRRRIVFFLSFPDAVLYLILTPSGQERRANDRQCRQCERASDRSIDRSQLHQSHKINRLRANRKTTNKKKTPPTKTTCRTAVERVLFNFLTFPVFFIFFAGARPAAAAAMTLDFQVNDLDDV